MFSRRTLLEAGAGLWCAAMLATSTGAIAGITPIQETVVGPGGRSISVTRWRPVRRRRGVVLFSHGALSSPAKYDLLILPWVDQGFEVWAPLHVDSLQHPDRASFAGLKAWTARIEDMHALADHVGSAEFIAAGHSYGALVALTLAGAQPAPPPGLRGPLADARARAVVGFSPPGLMPGFVEPGCYAHIGVPAFIQTGTADLLPPGKPNPDPQSWHQHLLAYDEAAPGGHRYGLVLDGVNHYFGGAICDFARPGPPKVREAGIAAGIAATFLRAYGCNEAPARRRLEAQRSDTGPVMLLSK